MSNGELIGLLRRLFYWLRDSGLIDFDTLPAPLKAVLIAAIALLALGIITDTVMRLIPRDKQRLFSPEQRTQLRHQAHGRCEHKPLIGRRCRQAGVEADHVIPWSRGGRTRLSNGQWLCRRHNRAKSNRIPTPIYVWRLHRRRRKYA